MKIDPVAYVGAVVREVAVREQDGKPARAVIATRSYDTDIADLWDALTNAERIPRWFMGPVDLPAGLPRSTDVRPHPHIGLATVTYLFAGEIMPPCPMRDSMV